MHGSDELLIAGLKRALWAGDELPLFTAGKAEGCFLGRSGAEGEAAQTALDRGLLELVRTEAKAKASTEWVRLTARGLEHLKAHESPKAALEEARQLLELNVQGAPLWAAELKAHLTGLSRRLDEFLERQDEGLRRMRERVEAACRRIDEDPLKRHGDLPPWQLDLLGALQSEPRPAPFSRLFLPLSKRHPTLTLGEFQEGLLALRLRRLIELLPADGAAEELAEPEFALPHGGRLFIAARLA